MDTLNRFNAFIDKTSSIVLEVLINELQEVDDSWGIKPKIKFCELSDNEKWSIECQNERAEFIQDEYQDYYDWQEEIRRTLWKLGSVA